MLDCCMLLGFILVTQNPRPVPVIQAIPQPYHQVSFQRDGVQIARYHFGPTLRRPFIFPVIGPSGRSLTRMGHPRDPESHSHHNSVWISHHDVNGVDFWGDRGKGKIVHQRIEQFEDENGYAYVLTQNAWIDEAKNETLLTERRCTRVELLPLGEWRLVIDLQLEARSKAVTLGKTPFGLIGVRVAKTIGVNDGGGILRDSEGRTGEKEIFWKRARWVDYSGPVTPLEKEGLTLLDHPSNPNHPTGFHVRSDGWMGASLTLEGPLVLTPGKPQALRYGLYVHHKVPQPARLQQQWEEFARTKPMVWPVKR